MHEMSIAQNIFDIVRREMERHDVTRVITINLKVGRMSAIVPSSLTFCWSILTEGSPLEGARLSIDEIPVQARCRECGHEFNVEKFIFICPKCEGVSIEMLSGRELVVQDIEAE
jgi:hydrogenase nickel incorporation protein HypA/HybF